MGNLTPSVIADLGRFLDRHTDVPEAVAREIVRAASSSLPVDLPPAVDFAGEVLRGQLAVLLKAGGRVASASASAPVASTPVQPSALSGESRRAVFRAAAGPRLVAFADALAETSVPDEQALGTIETARANLPPETARAAFGFPEGYLTVEERARGLPELGPSAPPMSKAETVSEGWRVAFSKAERKGGAL